MRQLVETVTPGPSRLRSGRLSDATLADSGISTDKTPSSHLLTRRVPPTKHVP